MAGEKQAKPSNLSKSQPDSSNTSFGFGPAAASSATSVQNQAVPVEVPIQITAAMSNDTDSSEVILESPFACLSAPAATPMLQTSSNMQRLSSEPCAGRLANYETISFVSSAAMEKNFIIWRVTHHSKLFTRMPLVS